MSTPTDSALPSDVVGVKQAAPAKAVVLTVIKAIHTLAWFSIESCMIYLLYAGLRRKSDQRAAIAGAIVAGESLVFVANGFRCPLTKLAVKFGAARGGVTDIFLPRWFAHNLPVIHVPLLALAVGLHVRNIRVNRARGSRPLLVARHRKTSLALR